MFIRSNGPQKSCKINRNWNILSSFEFIFCTGIRILEFHLVGGLSRLQTELRLEIVLKIDCLLDDWKDLIVNLHLELLDLRTPSLPLLGFTEEVGLLLLCTDD